jgi:metal-responsive CopG/Arc/MetJ family transcriptional regulator
MKTAISLPDDLFLRAEAFAHQKTMNRSELYAKALTDYLEQHDHNSITTQLNDIYNEIDSSLPAEIAELGFETLRRVKQ